GHHHRDGELRRRPGIPGDLLALVAEDRPHARGGGGDRRARLAARPGARDAQGPVGILGKARDLLRVTGDNVRFAVLLLLFISITAEAQNPPLIRFGRGFAAEENVWLMSARKDLTPNQDKAYRLNQVLFQANPERFQAFLAGELDGGTAPGLA